MRARTVDIDERGEDNRHGDLGAREDVGHKGGEFGVLIAAAGCTAAVLRRAGAPHGKIDSVGHTVNEVVWMDWISKENKRKRWRRTDGRLANFRFNNLEERRRVVRGVDERSWVDGAGARGAGEAGAGGVWRVHWVVHC